MQDETGITNFVYSFNVVRDIPLDASDIVRETKQDLLLLKVLDFTLSEWPNHINDVNLKPYFQRRNYISTEHNCLSMRHKVIIPSSLRKEVLNLVHEQHLGIMRTKMLMKNYCWWPGMSDDIEKFIGLCDVCQYTQNFSNNNALLSCQKQQLISIEYI